MGALTGTSCARCLASVVTRPRIWPEGPSCDSITMRMAPLVSETRWMYMLEAGIYSRPRCRNGLSGRSRSWNTRLGQSSSQEMSVR